MANAQEKSRRGVARVLRRRHRNYSCAAFFGSQIEMDGGREDEREDHGTQNAADHGDSERLQHCRAGADAECQREHAGDSG